MKGLESAPSVVRPWSRRDFLRVVALAAPGEVLVSRTVRDLVVGSGIALEDRGIRTFKGMIDQWQLFAVS